MKAQQAGRVWPRPVAKAALLWLAACLATTAAPSSAAVARDQAISMVTETLLGGSLDGLRLHVRPAPLAAGEVVSGWHSAVFTAPAAGWLIFIDPTPLADWEHPCQFVFVDGAMGDVAVHASMTPPSPPGQLAQITSGRDNPIPGESEKLHAWLDRRLREIPHPPLLEPR